MSDRRKTRVGKRGTVTLPPGLLRRFSIKEGSEVVAEAHQNGILIRPVEQVEIYTPERKAEFLLNNAVDAEDYARAVKLVRKMGLDPAQIPHRKPNGA